ncbi:hypothetical protein TWF102_005374 [Orbilia oligospora]|uniref:Uncharacterized protein n=1 Tax=Orbilia oligospora TaxID=2813651 RepID=A0A7C8NAV9_ORBOL|nr:hypothetical protein TWF102_005374 [Orbilia oligospora]KAF3114152.1 hypothetical protein TWF103_001574 [Orbilia oligospora]
MSGNTWPSSESTQLLHEDAKIVNRPNSVNTSAKRSSQSDLDIPPPNPTKRRRYPVKNPKASQPKTPSPERPLPRTPPPKVPQLRSPVKIIPRQIKPKPPAVGAINRAKSLAASINQKSIFPQNAVSAVVDNTAETTSSNIWKRNIIFTNKEFQIHVYRAKKPFYIKKCGYPYIYYYNNAHPTAVYPVRNMGQNQKELEIVQSCSGSSHIINVLTYGSIGHILLNVFQTQDLNQIYSFQELREEVIWYIAREVRLIMSLDSPTYVKGTKALSHIRIYRLVYPKANAHQLLEGINFRHGLDIVLNTMSCQ